MPSLPHIAEKYHGDWDDFSQPLTYAYNLPAHPSTETTPPELVVARQPFSMVATDVTPQGQGTDAGEHTGTVQYKLTYFRRLRNVLAHARAELAAAQ